MRSLCLRLAVALAVALLAFGQWMVLDDDAPRCPVCKRAGEWPNKPLAVADEDGVFRGLAFPRTRLFVCQSDGTVFAGGWGGDDE